MGGWIGGDAFPFTRCEVERAYRRLVGRAEAKRAAERLAGGLRDAGRAASAYAASVGAPGAPVRSGYAIDIDDGMLADIALASPGAAARAAAWRAAVGRADDAAWAAARAAAARQAARRGHTGA